MDQRGNAEGNDLCSRRENKNSNGESRKASHTLNLFSHPLCFSLPPNPFLIFRPFPPPSSHLAISSFITFILQHSLFIFVSHVLVRFFSSFVELRFPSHGRWNFCFPMRCRIRMFLFLAFLCLHLGWVFASAIPDPQPRQQRQVPAKFRQRYPPI